MKDIQGVQRGKCNSCECEEFRCSPEGLVRCDYCNHTPGEHVRIVDLGECLKCEAGNCAQYMSEKPNAYTECQYCGCEANCHKGADALRKPKNQASAAPTTPGAADTCKYPGCQFPKRVDGDRVHDFCSRTCATKFTTLSVLLTKSASSGAQGGGVSGGGGSGNGRGEGRSSGGGEGGGSGGGGSVDAGELSLGEDGADDDDTVVKKKPDGKKNPKKA